MARIFISYRRADSADMSRHIYDELVKRVGEKGVFRDVDTLIKGHDFRAGIERFIFESNVILVLIGDKWLNIPDDNTGERRLDNPEDFVRIEIDMGLRHVETVIPILVNGASMPSETELPVRLSGLAFKNAVPLRDSNFDEDFAELLDAIGIQSSLPWWRKPIAIAGFTFITLFILIAAWTTLNPDSDIPIEITEVTEDTAIPSDTLTPTVTLTDTVAPSDTPTSTDILAIRETETEIAFTPTNTLTPTATDTPSNTPTNTATATDTPSNTPTNTPAAPSATATLSRPQILVVSDAANVRSGPDIVFEPPSGYLSKDAIANILAVNPAGTWYKIQYYAGEGWISATIVEVTGDISSLPRDAGPATPVPATNPPTPTNIPTLTSREQDEAMGRAEARVSSNGDWEDRYPNGVPQDFGEVEMVLVPVGCFTIGSSSGESNERNGNVICFDEPFWIDKYEVSQGQLEDFNFPNDNFYNGSGLPAEQITWFEAKQFCEDRRGGGTRLPTEVEWEYAARGPDGRDYPWENGWNSDFANWGDTSPDQTMDVDKFPEGVSWVGAYNMSGNVREWTSSLYYLYDVSAERETDTGTRTDVQRVMRGGSFFDTRLQLRSTHRFEIEVRNNVGSIFGFRCARSYDE